MLTIRRYTLLNGTKPPFYFIFLMYFPPYLPSVLVRCSAPVHQLWVLPFTDPSRCLSNYTFYVIQRWWSTMYAWVHSEIRASSSKTPRFPCSPAQFAGLLWLYIMQQWLSPTDQSNCLRCMHASVCLHLPVGVANSLTLCTCLRLQLQIMGHCVRQHEVEYPQGCWVYYAGLQP